MAAAKKSGSKESGLLMFYGTECVHCHTMMPLVKKLEKEEKVKVKLIECWHNAKNDALRQKYDDGLCGGVPFFYNEKTKDSICGAVPYSRLKEWALGK